MDAEGCPCFSKASTRWIKRSSPCSSKTPACPIQTSPSGVGVSRVAVKMRVQALEKRGVIEEYTTIVDPQKISGAVSCYFEIETEPQALSAVTDILNACDTITQIYRVTGKNKLHVHAVAASAGEMERLIREVVDPLPGVLDISTNIILSRVKDIKGLRL